MAGGVDLDAAAFGLVTLPLTDGAALGTSYAWVAGLLLLAEGLRKAGRMSSGTARKVVHVGVGLWIVPTVFVFSDWRVAVIPPLSFVVVNFLVHRFRLVPALAEDPTNFGTTFFPISFAALLALFFRPGEAGDLGFVAVAGVLAMALGDAAAAVFGRRYGTRRYTILGHSRTMEGSLAMCLVTAAAVTVVLTTMAGFGWHAAVAFGLVTGTAAAGIEAVCPFGSDNLFVPLGTAGLLWAFVELSAAAIGIG